MLSAAYKYRALPNDAQRQYIGQCFGCCRVVYNHFLKVVTDAINNGEPVFTAVVKGTATYWNLNKEYWQSLTVKSIRGQYPFLDGVSAQALNATLEAFKEALLDWKRSREGYIKAKGNPRYKKGFFKAQKRNSNLAPTIRDEYKYPRFKDKFAWQSFSNQNNQGKPADKLQNRLQVIDEQTASLTVIKLPGLRLVYHRALPETARICTVTISRSPSYEYYAAICFETDQEQPAAPEQDPQLIQWQDNQVTASGKVFDRSAHHDLDHIRSRQERLAVLSRRISKARSRCPDPKTSKRYRALLIKRAKVEESLIAQRRDWQHKVSAEIVANNPFVDLPPDDLRKQQKKDGAGVKAQSWGEFRNMCAYKAEWLGGTKRKTKKGKVK